MAALIIGVDGGGSRTRVTVCDESGVTVAAADGPGSAVRPGEIERSAQVVRDVVNEALSAISGRPGQVRMLCVGVAGVGREAEHSELVQALEAWQLAASVLVVTDATIALEDAFGNGPGILLTAGTGSIAYGRGPTGSFGRCGGWGPVCGDEGGGAWIGRRALGVVTASHDGREPETDLIASVLAAAGVGAVDGLVAWAAGATPADLARLAPGVLEVAATGDLRANSLVTLTIEELGLHVRTLARRLFGDERAAFRLALNGGLLSKGTLLRRRLEHRLKSMTPGAQIRPGDIVPERGAVRLGLRDLGMQVPEPQSA